MLSKAAPNRHRTQGFTMAEIIVIIVILAICAAVIIPRVAGASDMKAMAAARLVASDLQYAQNEAVTSQNSVTVTFTPAGDSYSLSNASGTLIHPMTKSAYIVNFATQPGFSNLDIVSASFAGSATVTFDAMGSPDQGGTVELMAGSSRYRVRVAATIGNVSVSRVGS